MSLWEYVFWMLVTSITAFFGGYTLGSMRGYRNGISEMVDNHAEAISHWACSVLARTSKDTQAEFAKAAREQGMHDAQMIIKKLEDVRRART